MKYKIKKIKVDANEKEVEIPSTAIILYAQPIRIGMLRQIEIVYLIEKR